MVYPKELRWLHFNLLGGTTDGGSMKNFLAVLKNYFNLMKVNVSN